jgi:predicted GNAT superfamily acetyltransferase
MNVRDAEKSDWPAILALNAESVHFLSPLDEARLTQLAKAACYLRVVVSPEFRGRKLADCLYDDFESFARAKGWGASPAK